jgi:hypothetical protein
MAETPTCKARATLQTITTLPGVFRNENTRFLNVLLLRLHFCRIHNSGDWDSSVDLATH